MLETEKRDAERQAVRLEKDKNALRCTLDKVRGGAPWVGRWTRTDWSGARGC